MRGPQAESLFVHRFELGFAVPEGGQEQPIGIFVEVVPYFEEATALEFVGPQSMLRSLSLEGTPPSIRLIEPQPGDLLAGPTRVEWRADDPDSDRLEFIVEFSADGGETFAYRSLNPPAPATTIDFDELPGCSGDCLLRVRVSDGVNNAQAVVRGFSVGTKGPEAEITFPRAGMIFQEGQVVSLYSDSRDPDDGYLDGEAVTWRSDRDGLLGTGRQFHAYALSEGRHTITFTVEDSDGNQASDTVTVQVDGTMPELELWVVRDKIPSRCVDVTVRAADEEGGSGLRDGGISLDGGETWHPLPLDQLPYHFIVPTTGDVHIVVWVEDHAGNVNGEDLPFEISEACPEAEPLPTAQATES